MRRHLPFKHFDPKNSVLFYRLLCLCTNYKIISLRTRIIHFLEQEWPTSVISWDQRESHFNTLASLHPPADAGGIHEGPYLDDLLPEPASIVRLARTHNIPSILPAALYELSRTDPNADYMKLHTQPYRQSIPSLQMLSACVRSALWTALSNEEHMYIHRGQDAMQRLLLHFFENLPRLCFQPVCIQGRIQLRAQIWSDSIKRRDVLSALQSMRDGRYMIAHGVCSKCTLQTIEAITKIRQVIFQSLGHLFGVTG